jgi:hypothetical protein
MNWLSGPHEFIVHMLGGGAQKVGLTCWGLVNKVWGGESQTSCGTGTSQMIRLGSVVYSHVTDELSHTTRSPPPTYFGTP